MPPGLHGELARAAERQRTSLNGYIIARLTESVGWSEADETTASGPRRDGRMLTWLLVANVVAVATAGLAALAILLFAV
jgi:HicB family